MKQKKYSGGGSSGGDSSEDDERIIHPEEFQEGGNKEVREWDEEEDIFENSQDLTQIVPRSTAVNSESPKKKKKKKEKRKDKDSEAEESRHGNGNVEEEDEDTFENSQDVTQIVPRQSVKIKKEPETPKKKNKEKQREFLSPHPVASPSSPAKTRNGYRIREVDVSEVPEHVISNMKRILPKDSDGTGSLSSEDIQKATDSSKGGAWIFQCSKSVNLSNLLTGKKLPLDWLDGGRFLFQNNEEDHEDPELTQGTDGKNRQFEAVSVTEEGYTEGMMVLLPDSNNFKMVTAPVNGHIIIREAVQELTIPTVKVKKSKPRKLPSGIKERHPVYGADFTSIIQEMEAAKAPSPKKKKKSQTQNDMSWEPIKQNAFGKSGYEPYANEEDIILKQEEILSSKKKKKKKKHAEAEEPEPVVDERLNGNSFEDWDEKQETGGAEVTTKKRKRKRQDDSFDLDETQILVTSNDNDVIVKKRKKSKHRE